AVGGAGRGGEGWEQDGGGPPPATAGSDWPGALLLCSHHQCAYPWRALADLTGGGHVTGPPRARARHGCCGAGDAPARWRARGPGYPDGQEVSSRAPDRKSVV